MGDDLHAGRRPDVMRWPAPSDLDPMGYVRGHHHPHSEETHHVGPCDPACRGGQRYHRHERPISAVGIMASQRAQRMRNNIREARGLPPEVTSFPPPYVPP